MRLADVNIESLDNLVVARLDGEIDLSNAIELGAVIANRVPNEVLGLVIDLTKVEYIDSVGIHVLFELRDKLKTRGQGIGLVAPGDSDIFVTLKVAYLPSVVVVFDTVDAAAESIAARSG
jgi:anti-sigma B factor antagonist